MRLRLTTITLLISYLFVITPAYAKGKSKKGFDFASNSSSSQKDQKEERKESPDMIIMSLHKPKAKIATTVKEYHNALASVARGIGPFKRVEISDQSPDDFGVKWCGLQDLSCLSTLGKKTGATVIVLTDLRETGPAVTGDVVQYTRLGNSILTEQHNLDLDPKNKGLKDLMRAYADALFYGNVGDLTVKLTGPAAIAGILSIDGTEVQHDGTWSKKDLTLGEHTIQVVSPTGTQTERKVILKGGEGAVIEMEVEGELPEEFKVAAEQQEAPAVDRFSMERLLPWELPGWIAMGVGVAGITTGIVGSAFESIGRQKMITICESEGNSCTPTGRLAGTKEVNKFTTARRQASTGLTLEVIGYSVGIASVIAGSYLLYMAYIGDPYEAPKADSTSNSDVTISFVPYLNGAGVVGTF